MNICAHVCVGYKSYIQKYIAFPLTMKYQKENFFLTPFKIGSKKQNKTRNKPSNEGERYTLKL